MRESRETTLPVIRPATADELAESYSVIPWRTVQEFALIVDGDRVAYAGLKRSPTGRLFGYFNGSRECRRHGWSLFWKLRSVMRRTREPIYVLCQAEVHPTAERLLSLLGFHPTEEMRDAWRVWQCPTSGR